MSEPPKKPVKLANQKTQAEFAMEELRKTAASRGIPVEKLIAQMVQQYLKEDKDAQPGAKGPRFIV